MVAMKIEAKTLKKLRANEERALRGHIQVFEACMNVGKWEQAKHELLHIKKCANNLAVQAAFSWEENDDED